jgi:hypothetical protein
VGENGDRRLPLVGTATFLAGLDLPSTKSAAKMNGVRGDAVAVLIASRNQSSASKRDVRPVFKGPVTSSDGLFPELPVPPTKGRHSVLLDHYRDALTMVTQNKLKEHMLEQEGREAEIARERAEQDRERREARDKSRINKQNVN